MTEKELQIKEHENKWGSTIYKVYYKNEEVFRWNDSANSDYPEDLCWERTIADIFFDGVALGKRMAIDKKGTKH